VGRPGCPFTPRCDVLMSEPSVERHRRAPDVAGRYGDVAEPGIFSFASKTVQSAHSSRRCRASTLETSAGRRSLRGIPSGEPG
jgi:hypothetical protein